MSFSKLLSGLFVASVFALGCGSDQRPDAQDQVQQSLRGDGYTNTNYNQLLGGKAGDSWISAIHFDGSQWYLSTLTNQTYAPVTSITYDGVEIQPSSLTTSQGVFMLVGDREELIQDRSHTLDFHIDGTLKGTLRMVPASTSSDGSFTRYTSLWIAEGTSEDAAPSFCPHTVSNTGSPDTVLTEYVIPIGGARWAPNGARTNDASAITLGCTHDVVGGCVNWGYGPWGSRIDESGQTRSMVSVHQACTRMKRGDFCGTGDAGTTGQSDFMPLSTTIHVKDRVGIHPDTNQTYATMEAFWDEGGAACVNASEYRSNDTTAITKFQILMTTCPARNVPCTANHTRLFLSARPCTGTDKSGNCISN